MLDTVPELYLYIYEMFFKDYGAAIFLVTVRLGTEIFLDVKKSQKMSAVVR